MTDNKYDRQLRLWGWEGQKKLSEASILLINATAAGTEALKNLILPGVGFITILDDKLVEERDLGSNFFVSEEGIGKSRGENAKDLLVELNEDVKGDHIDGSPSKYLRAKDKDFFSQFSFIIAWDMTETQVEELTEIGDDLGIAIIILRSYGMIGYLRQYKKEHTCIQSKPADKQLDDLRLAHPFEALQKYALEFDSEQLNLMEHGHVPYVIILIKALHKWKEVHEGKLPSSFEEKDEFKAIIRGMARNFSKELNYEEAIQNAFKAFSYEAVPFEIQEILDDPKANSEEFHSKFWTLVAALKQFVSERGSLPVNGKVPDMTSTSDFYITLQKIYQEKAREDRERMESILSEQAEKNGKMDIIFDEDEVKIFWENWRNLEVTRMNSFSQERNQPETEDVSAEFLDSDSSIEWYVAVRWAEMFRSKKGRYAGDLQENIEEDVIEMSGFVPKLLKDLGAPEEFKFNYNHIHEIVRYSNSCLHNIAAVLGGVAAQEAVKLITEQYTPLNHTFIFDGVHSKSQVFNI